MASIGSRKQPTTYSHGGQYLTPFRVRQISTTLDDYVYTSDDTVEDGDVDREKRYTESDFNRIIEIKQREAKRVALPHSPAEPKHDVAKVPWAERSSGVWFMGV